MRRALPPLLLVIACVAFAPGTRAGDALPLLPGPALTPASVARQAETAPARVGDLERRLSELERRHQQELDGMRERVRELEAQAGGAGLRLEQEPKRDPGAVLQPPRPLTPEEQAEQEVERMLREATGAPATAPSPTGQETVESAIDQMLRAAEQPGQPRPAGGLSVLNPNITLIGDFLARLSSLPDKYHGARGVQLADFASGDIDGFEMREVSLEARSAVDPFADAVFVLAFGERSVEIEEAYVLFHTYPESLLKCYLEGWQAKVGVFHMDFGAVNLVHNHDLPTVDRPVALQNFVTGDGLIRAGISLSKSFELPEKTFAEWVIELANGEALGDELDPLPFTGRDNPLAVTRFKTFREYENPQCEDPTRWWNPWIRCVGRSDLQLGTSAAYTARFDSPSHEDLFSFVEGADLTWKGYDPSPQSYRSYLIQSELIASQVEITPGSVRGGLGAYLLGQVRLDRNWFVGLRGDAVQFPDTWGHQFAITPFVTYFLSEFNRVRVQYQFLTQQDDKGVRDDVGVADGHTLWVQWSWAIGAHPPEPYYVSPRF